MVGAVYLDSTKVGFSSVGPTADGRTKPDVSAQGALVHVAYSSPSIPFGPSSGTSFSAPMITGIVSQILQVNPNLNPKKVWEVLTSTASQSASPDNNLVPGRKCLLACGGLQQGISGAISGIVGV